MSLEEMSGQLRAAHVDVVQSMTAVGQLVDMLSDHAGILGNLAEKQQEDRDGLIRKIQEGLVEERQQIAAAAGDVRKFENLANAVGALAEGEDVLDQLLAASAAATKQVNGVRGVLGASMVRAQDDVIGSLNKAGEGLEAQINALS